MVHTRGTFRKVTFMICALALAIGVPVAGLAKKAAAALPAVGVYLKVNGEKVSSKEPPLVKDGRLYVPAASLADMLDAVSIKWNKASEEAVIRTAQGDSIVLGNGVPVVYYNGGRYWMDAEPFLTEGRLYVPLRLVAELMHASVAWGGQGEPAELTTAAPKPEPAIELAVADSATTAGVEVVEAAVAGEGQEKQEARVVEATVLDHPVKAYSEADFKLLAKIVQVEAGDDSYEGQLAVANVILNRVKSGKFPGTIKEVIYSGKQFPPAHNGLLDKSVPRANALRAAKDALNGKNNVEGAVYFYDPDVSKGGYWKSLEYVAKIGEHVFAK